MYNIPTQTAFDALAAQGYNRIPLTIQLLSDLDTPLSVYLKLCQDAPYSFLLESVIGGERFGRYSFIGLQAHTRIESTGFDANCTTNVIQNGEIIETHTDNPLEFIEAYQQRFNVALLDTLPLFCGGLAGYFGYDAVRHIEPKLQNTCPPDTLGCPDIMLLLCEDVAVVDNLTGKLTLITYANPADANAYTSAQQRLQERAEKLLDATPSIPTSNNTNKAVKISTEFQHDPFIDAVLRAKNMIAHGEFMQIQVGQRLHRPFDAHPLQLYRALRSLNPSPYMYYYHMGDFQIVGTSPEILVRQEQIEHNGKAATKATIRPLAGTRPRHPDAEQDKLVEQELLADPKERAEHLMLIDLARNDIGRIAQTGTVKVTEAFAVERYSHVMHIVSNVEGVLQPNMSNIDVLKASFPAGTLTGAPKIHAMEIIDQLEPSKRGIYGGACGHLSFNGNMDLAIAIRTGIVKNNRLYAQASAGVVADSQPELEWQETQHKASALLRAAELVDKGL